MRRPYRSSNREHRLIKRGDITSLVRVDNPDDMEIAKAPGEGDGDSLVGIDSPDDADYYFAEDNSGDRKDYAKLKKCRRKV